MFVRLYILQRQLQANAVDLSKQKVLVDADSRLIQQIVFQGVAGRDDKTKKGSTLFLRNQIKKSYNFTKEH